MPLIICIIDILNLTFIDTRKTQDERGEYEN